MSKRMGFSLALLLSLGFHAWLLSGTLSAPSLKIKEKPAPKTVTVTLNRWQPPAPPQPAPKPRTETPLQQVVKQKPKPKPPKPIQPKPKPMVKAPPKPVKKTEPVAKSQPIPKPEKMPVAVVKTEPTPIFSTQTQTVSEPPAPDPSILENYLAELRNLIESHKHYPIPARRLRHEGVVEVAFVIGLDGYIRQVRLAKGSESHFLNQAALECVQGLGRFKPLPPEIVDDQLALTIPIVFKII